jgi:predicted house-cleaning noncanonical NTP pyrophosphatase (MazG superfamily)
VARILLVGADATPQDRQLLAHVAKVLQDAGHEPIAVRLELEPEPAREILRHVQSADAVIGLLDRVENHPLSLLLGLASASRRPILGMRGDPRTEDLSPSLRSVLQDLVMVNDWTSDSTKNAILQFAGAVRVFAGTLVRDAVPKLLKDEGKEMRFRQVAETEYPPVLKRKLVETAQRLEESEFGVEQEEIADMLELLETLINLRRYDRESLRSIKEGKWRKRGGFQKGFLLDEEPALSSR